MLLNSQHYILYISVYIPYAFCCSVITVLPYFITTKDVTKDVTSFVLLNYDGCPHTASNWFEVLAEITEGVYSAGLQRSTTFILLRN